MRAILPALAVCACGGTPKFAHTLPKPLVPASAPAEHVRVEVAALPWWVDAGDAHLFPLWLDSTPAVTPGRDLGAVRSDDISLDDDQVSTLECAWRIGENGEPVSCEQGRSEAMASLHGSLHRAFRDLRQRAGAAGANVVSDVHCFGARAPARMWCEGVARIADAGQPTPTEDDPAAPTSAPPELAPTRFAVIADESMALQGRNLLAASSVGVRYRPVEVTFDVLDVSHDGHGPLVGLGGTAMWRFRVSHGADAIIGGSAAAIAPNGATNPQFTGWFSGFVGFAYQSSWRYRGIAQPWVQVRLGGAHDATGTLPLLALHLGLASPDR